MFFGSPGWQPEEVRLQRRLPALAGANPDHIVHRNNEDFAITKLACPGGLRDCLDHGIFNAFGDDDFNLDLWDKLDLIFRAAIGFGMSLLTTITLNLADGHPGDTDFLQSVSDRVQKVRSDDCLNLLHLYSLLNHLLADRASQQQTLVSR